MCAELPLHWGYSDEQDRQSPCPQANLCQVETQTTKQSQFRGTGPRERWSWRSMGARVHRLEQMLLGPQFTFPQPTSDFSGSRGGKFHKSSVPPQVHLAHLCFSASGISGSFRNPHICKEEHLRRIVWGREWGVNGHVSP